MNSFNTLKSKLTEGPVLAICSHGLDTELVWCDLPSKRKPVFLFQQANDKSRISISQLRVRNISNYICPSTFPNLPSGNTLQNCDRCNSIKCALNKQEINRRINHWALILQKL